MNRILGTFAAAALFLATNAFAAAPGKVTVQAPAGGKQGAVTFDHGGATHKGLKCTDCHADDKGGKIDFGDAKAAMAKGHAACQKCHNEKAKEDASKAALKACTNCHAKK